MNHDIMRKDEMQTIKHQFKEEQSTKNKSHMVSDFSLPSTSQTLSSNFSKKFASFLVLLFLSLSVFSFLYKMSLIEEKSRFLQAKGQESDDSASVKAGPSIQITSITASNKNQKQNSAAFEQTEEGIPNGDFVQEEVYKNADPEIKQIFNEMISRPKNKKSKPNKTFQPTQKAYFAYKLFTQPENEKYLKAEYYYYDQKYGIGQTISELPLCIVAPGRNLAKNKKFQRFLESIERQNYTNFKLVYIDDASDDNTPKFMSQFVHSKLPRISSKLVIVKNRLRVYALANRNNGIRNYCHENDIVLDVDADDAFIGKQVFKFINALYQNSDVWQSNSVFIYVDQSKKEVTTGPQDGVPAELLFTNSYRGSMVWKTSELRTFRAKLFNKINQTDFKDSNGKFYEWASDVFIQEPLVELASQGHYQHLYEIVYFYDWNFDRSTVYKRRHYRDIAWCQTPYKPLKSLDDDAEKVENYRIPERMVKEKEKNMIEARKEAKKYGRAEPF